MFNGTHGMPGYSGNPKQVASFSGGIGSEFNNAADCRKASGDKPQTHPDTQGGSGGGWNDEAMGSMPSGKTKNHKY